VLEARHPEIVPMIIDGCAEFSNWREYEVIVIDALRAIGAI
jgi:hypothetical protein